MRINPALITLARELRGWTQEELANAIGAVQGTISKYELGLIPVPQHHVLAIGDRLDFEPSFFSQPDGVVGLGGDFLYRKRANVPAKTLRRVEAEANLRRIQVGAMLRQVQMQEAFPFPAIQPEEKNSRIERVAREVRRAWRVPRGPVRNLTKLIERSGAIVFTVDFGTDSIDGTNIRQPGLPPLLFLNRKVSGERHRFNLAHEVGHAVMHFASAMGDAEDQANAFARELLMPREEIRSDLRNLDLAVAARLKPVWGVSMAAIIMQAWCLGQITESKYRRLFTQLNATGNRREEPLPLAFEEPELFDLMRESYRGALGLSEQELAQALFTRTVGQLDPPTPRSQLRLAQPGLFDEEA